MVVKLEPFRDDQGVLYWTAKIDDLTVDTGDYMGKGTTKALAMADLKIKYLAEQAQKAIDAQEIIDEAALKARTVMIEVNW